MGLWKRVTEKTKQAVGLKAANTVDWRPTSNGRNLAMIDEARRFSKQLKLLHRELREMGAKIEGNLGVLKNVLTSPLPRVYEMSDKGPMPVGREAVIVGTGVAFEVLTATATDLRTKLQQEVLHPLDQWQAAYRMIKSRNAKCEELRLELDAKRRNAATMAVNLEKRKAKAANALASEDKAVEVGGGGGNPAAGAAGHPGTTTKLEDAHFKLQKEEDKVTRLTQRFTDIEDEVYTALLTLINDTKVLKQYAAAALVVFQQAFSQAYTAFGPPGAAGVELEGAPASSITGSVAPGKSLGRTTPSSAGYYAKGSPGTPDQAPPPSAQQERQPVHPPSGPQAPTWYHDARENAAPMQDDSDDDT